MSREIQRNIGTMCTIAGVCPRKGSPVVAKCTKNYIARVLKGENVKPMLSVFEDVQAEQEKNL